MAWAIKEGTDIFKSHTRSGNLDRNDTVDTKIRNSIFGSFGQQLFIDRTGGHRVTKAECPGFWHDVTCTNRRLREYTGWGIDNLDDAIARDEIKTMAMRDDSDFRRKHISFKKKTMVQHAINSAYQRKLDCLVAFGVYDFDIEKGWADVQLLGVVGARGLLHRLTLVPSHFNESWYFDKREVNDRGFGLIYI